MALICVSRREEFTKNGSKTTGQVSFYSSRQDTDNALQEHLPRLLSRSRRLYCHVPRVTSCTPWCRS
ncbi:uncharacterized protein YALI1_D22922g [Yarrowia lipolytica]|uniref:Uncharacterized protein n=1 Tax=Yarrowia lipolytica TaxID=4952 RepID=A0A1D8NF65_YARLL|nr:hypothetical protein YALI1_D22922g [Yarrowia lipolytica]